MAIAPVTNCKRVLFFAGQGCTARITFGDAFHLLVESSGRFSVQLALLIGQCEESVESEQALRIEYMEKCFSRRVRQGGITWLQLANQQLSDLFLARVGIQIAAMS